MKQLLIITCCVVYFTGCKNNAPTGLPFFNDPDFTPVWLTQDARERTKLHAIPPFSFTDQYGQTITKKITSGRIYVANFFFTRCGNICPKMTINMHRVADVFANDSGVLFLSHTIAPAFDNVARLRQYAKEKNVTNSNWHLLTGSQQQIYTLATEGYFADAASNSAITNQLLHSENFILVDTHGHIRGIYNGTIDAEVNNLVKHIKMLKSEQ